MRNFRYALLSGLVLVGCGAEQDLTLESQTKTRAFVIYEPGQKGDAKAALNAAGGQLHRELDSLAAVVVSVPTSALNGLKNNPHIRMIEEDVPRYPLAAGQAQSVPYGIAMVQANQLSDANAANRKICIIDSGYGQGHEDLPAGSTVTGVNTTGTANWSE